MKNKKFPKWIAPVALFIVVMFTVLFFLQKLLMPKYMSDIVEGALTEEYYEETTDHEVIFVGDCEVYENFSPITLYEEFGSMTEQENMLDYLFPILRYHSRWSDLSSDDFKYMFKKDKISHNGYYMRVDVRPVKGFPEPDKLADYTLGSNAMKYLDKMRVLCEENGVEFVLVKSPSLFPHWYDEWDEQIETYAEKYGLDYFNYEKMAEEVGIDYNTDTYDAGLHLNLDGAEKLSKYFGTYLKENYDLTDYRENPEYEKVYEEKIQFYEDMKEAQYKELEEYGEIINY